MFKIDCAKAVVPQDLKEEEFRRMGELEERVQSLLNSNFHYLYQSSWTIGDFKIERSELSVQFTLADLKVSKKLSGKILETVVNTLNLQQNLDAISAESSLLERMQAVSYSVLDSVSLLQLQKCVFVDSLVDSAVWYALSPDESFLNRRIAEIDSCAIRTIYLRFGEMEARGFDCMQRRGDPLLESSPTIGTFRSFSGEEVNRIVSTLSKGGCALITDAQIPSLDLKLFKKKQLDDLISGDGEDRTVSHRLGLLTPDQLQVFLKKSSGRYFSKFPDSFYQDLPLSQYSAKQVKAFFDDDCGRKTESARARLQLVDSHEVARGLHLLAREHLAMLSDKQIASLDYRNLTFEQAEGVFVNQFRDEEIKQRVRLIPLDSVNEVLKVYPKLICYFSASQTLAADVGLLDREVVQTLFPGFTKETLYPGYKLQLRNCPFTHQVEYVFTCEGVGFSRMRTHSQKELDLFFEKNKQQCGEIAQKFSTEQLKKLKPLMHPELRGCI